MFRPSQFHMPYIHGPDGIPVSGPVMRTTDSGHPSSDTIPVCGIPESASPRRQMPVPVSCDPLWYQSQSRSRPGSRSRRTLRRPGLHLPELLLTVHIFDTSNNSHTAKPSPCTTLFPYSARTEFHPSSADRSLSAVRPPPPADGSGQIPLVPF